jgi:SAM-dependent methyltransferase
MNIKYDRIGVGYNTTRKADPHIAETMYKLLHPRVDELYLDIGCGTGNYTAALFNKGVKFIGMDPSNEMLIKAKMNYPDISWMHGKVENIPLEANIVDGIMAMLTIHHWDNLHTGFSELKRVVKSLGRFVLFTATAEQMEDYWLQHYFPKMLADSLSQMPSRDKIKLALDEAGWKIEQLIPFHIPNNLQDLFLYSGKHNPALYLNPDVRNGISSFSDLGNQDEVIAGLKRLEQDIESGTIEHIMSDYESKHGDYLFVVADAV